MGLVEIFYEVRDIPYRIPLAPGEPDQTCLGKTKRLLEGLAAEGAAVRPRCSDFNWSDLPLPSEVAAQPHEDKCGHIYLEILLGKDWKVLDPTWDKSLSNLFPVNEWDGRNGTPIAVPVRGKIYGIQESLEIYHEPETPEELEEDLAAQEMFYRAFNDWLEQLRRLR